MDPRPFKSIVSLVVIVTHKPSYDTSVVSCASAFAHTRSVYIQCSDMQYYTRTYVLYEEPRSQAFQREGMPGNADVCMELVCIIFMLNMWAWLALTGRGPTKISCYTHARTHVVPVKESCLHKWVHVI